ncbi:uncharacterized protein Mbs isoform X16 [Lepeophtheirus salmonis]|uniref:uncharacterized protein Mbs isoform X16 n=1 Tax=Lepeophtheirus salmonis TaxID=72036 RepID=UPI003AF395A5
MSIETRSNSALLKRAEQLKRWQESDTCRRSGEHRSTIKAKVQFTDGCVFLAACAASDKEEVRRLLARGADIDTANVDGLTALHQACIDDNLEMVEFLVERGADVNRGDNEGWTPLHATASCGFLSIAKYLLEHKCNVAAVNNDGELAIDISESDEMEELLQNEIDTRSIDCDASRVVEECMMFEDATKWVESDKFGDVPHQKTGATSLHVAAAKGYIKVIGLLLECNAPINIQDYDGWTPLHAAAHWSQREAIDLLCKNHADMDIKNYVGQTCFDVADPDVLKFLEDLKRKQASMQKDRPDFRNLANRPSTTTTSSLAHSGGRRRSSITRLSIDDKELRLKKDSSYERDSLRGSSLVSETIQESNKSNAESDSDVGRKNRANLSDNNSLPKITLSKDDSSNKVPGYSPPHPAESDKKKPISSSPSESSDDVHPWRRPVSLRSRPVSSTLNSKKDDSSDSEVPLRRIHSFESDEKKRYEPDGGNRVKSDSSLANNSLSSKHQPPQSHVRSVVDEKMNSSVPSTKEDDHPSMNDKSTLGSVFKNFFKSFVPPVRDEESETQRKAHAKRVRETRRSTQGVTLEDLKSAEQLVKKKQQQENQIRTSELQQLAAAASGGVGSTATTTVTTSATLVTSGGSSPASTPSSTSSAYDRKPSWRLRSSEGANDRNRFRLEDAGPSETLNALRKSSKIEGKGPPPLPSSDPPPLSSPGSKDGGTSVLSSSITTPTGTQKVIQRRKKPKRRSTGVVHLDIGDLDNEEEGDESETEDEMEAAPSLTLASLEREVNGLQVAAEEDEKLIVLRKDDLNSLLTAKPTLLIGKELNLSGDAKTSSFGGGASGNNPSSSSNNKYLHPNNAHQPTSGYHNKSMEKDSHNGGDIDYKKLWEESQLDNSRLRDELSKSEDTRGRLEGALHSASKPQMSETEKREKRALEKKLSEMEEELKQLQKFKAENERLKSENRALSRVVSKLTSSPAAATSSPSTKSSSALSKSSYGNF